MYKKAEDFSSSDIIKLLKNIIGPEKSFYYLVFIYGIGISLLSIMLPASVQYLINTITFVAIKRPVIVIGVVLFVFLCFYATLKVFQLITLYTFEKRFFSRILADISIKCVYASYLDVEKRNKTEEANRFFAIPLVQKVLPQLLIDGVTLFQQVVVGFIVVSFYNQFFFLFSLILGAVVWLVVTFFMKKGIQYSMETMNSVYSAASWFENLFRINGAFKSRRTISYATKRMDREIGGFIVAKTKIFKLILYQTIIFLVIYCVSGACYLVIGGLLVLEEKLTLGQLVAAEIILSYLLASIAIFGKYFADFYDLCSACRIINDLYAIPTEPKGGMEELDSNIEGSLKMSDVVMHYHNKKFVFNMSLEKGSFNLISSTTYNSQFLICDLLTKFQEPYSGKVHFGGHDIQDLNPHFLRDIVGVVNDTDVFEGSIKEYLTENNNISLAEIRKVLEIVMLSDTIENLDDGLDTMLLSCLYPLSQPQVVRLKIAKTLLFKPKILVVTQIFDQVRKFHQDKIMTNIRKAYPELTLICFTNRKDIHFEYDGYFFLDFEKSTRFLTIDELSKHEHEYFSKNL